MKTGLTFYDGVNNAINCLENAKTANPKDIQDSLEFLRSLDMIAKGACVLACYAGEDWHAREDAYGFGADGYSFLDKYLEGAIKLADKFGTEDFYDDYADYFAENIKPVE